MIDVLRRLVRAATLEAFTAAGVDARLYGWENRPTAPPASAQLWGEETLRRGVEQLVAGGDPRTYLARPLYQLTLHVALNEATGELDRVTNAVTTAFRPGRTLVASATDAPGAPDRVRDAAWLRVDCDTVDIGPPAPALIAGWAARPVRMGLITRRLVAADGTAVPFGVRSRVVA